MTTGQAAPKADQMSSSYAVVPLLATRYFYGGAGVVRTSDKTKCQADLKLYHLMTTTCLCWGYILPKVSLT